MTKEQLFRRILDERIVAFMDRLKSVMGENKRKRETAEIIRNRYSG